MKYIVTLFLILILATTGTAQIILTTADFLLDQKMKNTVQTRVKGYTIENPTTLSYMVGAGDSNQVWDLRKIAFTLQPQAGYDSLFSYPGGAPLASDPDFTSCNVIIRDTNLNAPKIYTFMLLTQNGMFDLGSTEDSAGVQSKIVSWNPPLQEQAIPVKYKDTWLNTSKLSGEVVNSSDVMTISTQANVDGWGTLSLPNSIPYSALRVKKQIITTDSKDGLTITEDTTFEYDFLTYYESSLKILTNAKNEIQTAEYTLTPLAAGIRMDHSDDNNFSITPNPSLDGETKVIYSLKNDCIVRLEIMDKLGNNLRMLQQGRVSAGQHVITLEPGILSNGVYFIRLISSELTVTKKLVVLK